MIITVYIKIYGRVQCVGYRYWSKKTANLIGGLSGWVRNTEDRSVEIFMSGEEEKVNQMLLSCQKGPPLARVDGIRYMPATIKGFLPEVEEGKFVII